MVKVKENELGIYAIYDKKGKKYDTPFFAFSDLFAKRRYVLMSMEEKSPLQVWPEDFELARVGFFNPVTGDISEFHEVVADGKDIKKQ